MLSSTAADRAIVRDGSTEPDLIVVARIDGVWVDISEDVEPVGSVSYDSERTLHRTAKVRMSRQLAWGIDWLRISQVLTAPSGTLVKPVGTFITSTPREVAGETPRTWEVDCYDLLWLLDDPVGETFVAEQGTGYLANVRTLVEAAGLTLTIVDEQADRLLAQDRPFSLADDWTKLGVVNQLLGAVGFRALWVDGGGEARSEPILGLANRGPEWTYRVDGDTEIAPGAVLERDTFGRVNRLRAVSGDPEVSLTPVELVVNDGFPERTLVIRPEAADQAALQALAEAEFDRVRQVAETVDLDVATNPFHAHRDVVRLVHPELDVDAKFLVRTWDLDLGGGDMSLGLERIVVEVDAPEEPGGPSGVLAWQDDDQKTAVNSGTSITVDAPDNIAEGDLLVCCILSMATNSSGDIFGTLPTGWSAATFETDGGSLRPGVSWLVKTATSSEPADYTFGGAASANHRALVGRVTAASGVDAVSGTNSGSSFVGSLAVSSVTAVGESLLLAAWAGQTGTSPQLQGLSPDAGMVALVSMSDPAPPSAAAREGVADGATGTRTGTADDDTLRLAGAMIVIGAA